MLPELRRYEWVAVLDADEFLVPAETYRYNLQRLLAAAKACFPSGPPAAILFPWFVRLWDCRYEYQPGLLAELYPHAIPFDLFKSVVRLAEVLSLVQVHVPTVRSQAFLVDSAFEKVPSDAVWTQSPKSFVGGRVEHFWGRSFEEFVIKKRRGDDLDVQMREYETFFAWAREATTENFAPMPTALIDRMRRNLATYEASGEYRGIMLKIDAWNRSHSERLRTDVELQSLYDKLYSRFRPSPDGSSARS